MATAIALGAACHRDKTNAKIVPGSVSAGGAAPDTQSATGRSLALDGTSTCDTLARLVKVATMQIVAVSSDSALPDPMSDSPGWRHGCGVQLADSTDTTGAPMEPIEKWLTGHGWVYAHYSADGPDGEVFGYAGHGRLCVVRGSWDGGDDSDTTYVPKPGYELSIACAPSVPADTAGYGELQAIGKQTLPPQPVFSGAVACPVPGGCGIAPPSVPPKAMIDLQHLISAARLRTTPWPAAAPLPLVDTVAKHGRAIARAIAAMLPRDSATVVDWNMHVEQQLELALCAIYSVKPEAGKTVWAASATEAANRALRQFWRDRVRSGS
jgi:hypothetical protein